MKVLRRENFRIEVIPRSPGDFGIVRMTGIPRSEEKTERECQEIADQIRRHVDGLPSYGRRGVDVLWDSYYVCKHCESEWTENSVTGTGGPNPLVLQNQGMSCG